MKIKKSAWAKSQKFRMTVCPKCPQKSCTVYPQCSFSRKKIDKTPKYNKILMFQNIWAVGSRKNKFSAKLDPKHPQIYCNVKRQITITQKLHRKTVILFSKTKKNYFFQKWKITVQYIQYMHYACQGYSFTPNLKPPNNVKRQKTAARKEQKSQ